jgi:hypothetical protein
MGHYMDSSAAGSMPSARIPLPGRLVPQNLNKGLGCRAPMPRLDHQEVVVLRRDGEKTETVEVGHRRDRDTPIGAMLGNRGGYRVMRTRLIGISGRLGAAQKAIDQRARAGTGIAIDHQNGGIGQSGL